MNRVVIDIRLNTIRTTLTGSLFRDIIDLCMSFAEYYAVGAVVAELYPPTDLCANWSLRFPKKVPRRYVRDFVFGTPLDRGFLGYVSESTSEPEWILHLPPPHEQFLQSLMRAPGFEFDHTVCNCRCRHPNLSTTVRSGVLYMQCGECLATRLSCVICDNVCVNHALNQRPTHGVTETDMFGDVGKHKNEIVICSECFRACELILDAFSCSCHVNSSFHNREKLKELYPVARFGARPALRKAIS